MNRGNEARKFGKKYKNIKKMRKVFQKLNQEIQKN